MIPNPPKRVLSSAESKDMSLKAGRVFSPRTPVGNRELFAGRWNEIKTLVDTVSQRGLHAVLYGERGVGKTSLANVIPVTLEVFDHEDRKPTEAKRITVRVNANSTDTFASVWVKALDEVAWHEEAPSIGFRPTPGVRRVTLREAFSVGSDLSIDDVRRLLTALPESVFIIDEFDRLPRKQAAPFTDLIKALSDSSTSTTIVLVGVGETVDGLVRDHASINRSLVQVPLRRMTARELREIIENAERSLGVVFDLAAGERIVVMSQGLPHYTHLIAQYSVRAACSRLSGVVSVDDVTSAFSQAVKSADHTISKLYADATHSAHAGALYQQVLLACAVAASEGRDNSGYFQPVELVRVLASILGRTKAVEVSVFNKHLVEFCDDKRAVLERTGRPRAYRYRFKNPLVPPYVLMHGVAEGLITHKQLADLASV